METLETSLEPIVSTLFRMVREVETQRKQVAESETPLPPSSHTIPSVQQRSGGALMTHESLGVYISMRFSSDEQIHDNQRSSQRT